MAQTGGGQRRFDSPWQTAGNSLLTGIERHYTELHMAKAPGAGGDRTPSPSVATLPSAGSQGSKSAKSGETSAPLKGSPAAASEALAKAQAAKQFEDASKRDDERRRLISEAAYYRAQRRGFEPGHEEEDWLEAEKDLDRDKSKPAS